MGKRSLNLALPGNPRYQPKSLQKIFGYDNLYRTYIEVEIANLLTLAEIGVIPKKDIDFLTSERIEKLLAITTTRVDQTEREITKHDIRALVMEMQKILPKRLGRWVHVVLTSYDTIDTGRALQYKRALDLVLMPAAREVIGLMSGMVRENAEVLQIGRTHKQHALPITVGFWMATILNRLIYNADKMQKFGDDLAGKISGAVGAYNAQVGLGLLARTGDISYEERVLNKLGLKPAPISTQILPPEPLSYFLFSVVMMSAALGQLGRDGRNLMSSEIGEILEAFDKNQTGSSTMAHKRNPINFENLEGMWLRTKNEYGKVWETLISDNQRDLVGSSVLRDLPIILVNVQQQLDTLRRKKDGVPFLARVRVDREACKQNFERNRNVILAEPLYIALQMAGYRGDAHELVNQKMTPIAKSEGKLLVEVLAELAESDMTIRDAYETIPDEIFQMLHQPENYIGLACEKALEVADEADRFVSTRF